MSETDRAPVNLASPATPVLAAPWRIRVARATRGRPALEIYHGERLIDVMVGTSLGAQLLRGAGRGERNGRRSVLAWGRLPEDGVPPRVFFGRALTREVSAVASAGAFWFALCEDDSDRVMVNATDGRREHLLVSPGWPY